MIDTSALVAALISGHEHHAVARPHLRAETRVPAIVIAETFAQLRRTFAQPVAIATMVLQPWTRDTERILPTTASAVSATMSKAVELDLSGSVHDALIAQVCIEFAVPLVTLDRRQHTLALALGAHSTYLLT